MIYQHKIILLTYILLSNATPHPKPMARALLSRFRTFSLVSSRIASEAIHLALPPSIFRTSLATLIAGLFSR